MLTFIRESLQGEQHEVIQQHVCGILGFHATREMCVMSFMINTPCETVDYAAHMDILASLTELMSSLAGVLPEVELATLDEVKCV